MKASKKLGVGGLGSLFSGLTISQRLWSAMGLVLVLFAAAAGIALVNLQRVEHSVATVVSENQPIVIQAMELNGRLRSATAALGIYLLTKEESHREAYGERLARAQESLAALQATAAGAADASVKERVAAIADEVDRFARYKDQFLELAKDDSKNMPGQAYALQNVSPLSTQMLGQLSTMILSETDEEATPERKELLSDIQDLRYLWANTMNNVRAYLTFRTASLIDEVLGLYQEETGRITDKLESNREMLTLEQDEALSSFADMRKQFFANIAQLKEIHGSEKWRTDAYLFRTEVGDLLARTEADLAALVADARSNIDVSSTELVGQVNGAQGWLAVLLVTGLVVGAGLAWLSNRLIAGPLNAAAAAMEEIADGDGDLSARLTISGRDEVARLAGAFNRFVGKIHEVVQHVAASTSQLASAAEEMSVVTEQMKQGAGRQHSETDQVATAMNEMAATVEEVARNAEAAAAAAQDADRQANDGKQVVSGAMNATDSLASEVNKASEVIHKLELESESIGKVLEVIQEIAEQTNLLALNAAIEAARAGEQGRGFAVVADEVRTLANRTQQSTQEIQQIIARLQQGAGEAVKVMEGGSSKAQDTVDQAKRAADALAAIAGAVSTINDMNTQIASAAEEQSAVAEEINRNITTISHAADQTANGAEQTASASEDLARLAAQLQGLVGQFKV
jgi:methyl-accepting chemotaxis protein